MNPMPICTKEPRRWSAPAFVLLVGIILQHCAEPKMIGINAGRIISSGAVMQDAFAVRDSPSMDEPACSMRFYHTAEALPPRKLTVSFFVFAADPQPTRLALTDETPESLNEVRGKAMFRKNRIMVQEAGFSKSLAPVWHPVRIWLHNQSVDCVALRGASTPPGQLVFTKLPHEIQDP